MTRHYIGLYISGANKASGSKTKARATNYSKIEATPTIETIYCATLWKYICYDKREPILKNV